MTKNQYAACIDHGNAANVKSANKFYLPYILYAIKILSHGYCSQPFYRQQHIYFYALLILFFMLSQNVFSIGLQCRVSA